MEKWIKLGVVGIDSGQIILMDPCYIDNQWKRNKGVFGGGTYEKCCKLTLSNKRGGQLNYKKGHPGLAVVSQTGFGDGEYPVYIKKKKNRIVEIKVVFAEERREK